MKAFAPGKLILAGEHAVVYGHPAIAFAVDLGTEAELTPCEGQSELLPSTAEDWDGQARTLDTDGRLREALGLVLPAQGVRLRLSTRLPVGRGMGSSAALSIAVIRAAARLQGREADLDEQLHLGMAMERVFHGNPSGLDHTVSARGGALWYRREAGALALEPLALPALRFVVLDSGVAGNTAELVAGVAARRPEVDPVLAEIGALVPQVRAALDQPMLLGSLLTYNHHLLQRLGVSTDRLDALVRLALDTGALGAKLCGAGGGGVVLALVADPAPLLAAAQAAHVPAKALSPALP